MPKEQYNQFRLFLSLMQEQGLPDEISLLPEYDKILQAIIELDENLQKRSYENEQKCVNDVFSVIQKAYWTLYMEQNADNLSEQQKKQVHFYLTSKIGKSLDSELSKSNLQSNKVPKWFMYKGYGKKQQRQQQSRRSKQVSSFDPSDRSQKSQWNFKYQNSLKTQQRQGTAVDPYHANIKLQAQNGLPQIEVIYRFFSIKSMLKNSSDMLDVEKITIINRKGNSYDRQDEEEVEKQKEKFRQKFKLYAQLIRCFQHYGYGARIVKKHSKQKITGVIYQYAVVHISKITFKLLEKYVMNFINKKTRYTHRARLQKITYNMFNLPNFFTPELKIIFIKLIKIVFEVEEPLPLVKKDQLQELYQYLIKQIMQKEKNPDKFKNQYMIKLENPTFYNVKKQLRDQVKQQAQERKRMGIRNKGRKSKASHQLNELKRSLAEQKQFLSRKKDMKHQLLSTYEKIPHTHKKKKHHKIKKQEYFSQQQYDGNDDDLSSQQLGQFDLDDPEDDQQAKEQYYDSDQQSEEIRDYFRRSNMGRQEGTKKKSKKSKKKKNKDKSKERDSHEKKEHNPEIYSDNSD